MDSNLNFEANYTSLSSNLKMGYNVPDNYTLSDTILGVFTNVSFQNISDKSVNSVYSGDTSYSSDTISEWWQTFSSQYLLHSTLVTVIIALAYFIILIAGVIGNSLVILSFIFCSKMQTVTNFFIMNLAVADLLTVCICFLGNLLSNTIRPWILGWFMCKAVAYVQGMSVCASAYMLAAISIDRCKAIYRPLGQPQGLRRSQAVYAIIFIWGLALCLPLPWAFTLTVIKKKKWTYCVELWPSKLYGQIYFFCVNIFAFYMLPSLFIIVSNFMIWCRIRRRQLPQAMAETNTIRQMHSQTKSGVRRILRIVTVVFLLSWVPLYFLVIRYKYFNIEKTEIRILHALLPFAQWLGSLNSSINPILYAFLNSKFRDAFKSLLPSCNKVPSSPAALLTNNEGTTQNC